MSEPLKVILAVLALIMAGCETPVANPWVVDECLNREIYRECMALLPKGPDKTVYNDWDDVIDECNDRAYYRSQKRASQVKPECR
jgi:hypothetical protein